MQSENSTSVGSVARNGFRLGAALAIVVVSAVGFLLLLFTEDVAASGSSLGDLSSSGEFLERDAAAEASGIDRLSYRIGDVDTVIPNHGVVPLGDDLLFEVAVSPYPPTSFDLDVELLLTTVQGAPIIDAEITTIWDMEFMPHGPFNTQFESVGDGRYTAFLDLFMVGPWKLDLDVAVPANQNPERVSITIYVWPE